ncbi:hypothetical protein [Desulfomonile tiedjei]|uniref:Uncharacterized protein n=1 Tax=Desulfomonile tiedjei (strain ATCC 49306 / DSM 6799 / DCB-1) TaxID=706587 RepID=I4C8V4_DESTA|nr:hypothetical protein [Desulfomonile tiedjei]AFM25995.1 hypothetical protein Desti_3338 [Desulfomonile tiedjei DSM 6799]
MPDRDKQDVLNALNPDREKERESGSSLSDFGEGAEVGMDIIAGASEFVEKTICTINETGTALFHGAADTGESIARGAAQITGAVAEHVVDVTEATVDAAATVLSVLLDS